MNNSITIGMDLGNKFHMAVVFDSDGNELETAKVTNTKSVSANFSNHTNQPSGRRTFYIFLFVRLNVTKNTETPTTRDL